MYPSCICKHDCAFDRIVSCTFVLVKRKRELMTFPEHLLKLRLSRGFSQAEAAEKAGIALRTYQYYERGQREPVLSTLIALADFYDLSLDELACRERKRNTRN